MTKATAPPRRNLFAAVLSYPLLLSALLATWVYLLVPRSMDDPDIWWHLRDAQYQLQTHTFLRRDLYSFTVHGASWMNHEWLAELPFYVGWRLLGTRGLFLVTATALECIFLGVFYLAWRHSKSIKAALLVTSIAAFISTVSFGPRTLLFGWIGLVAELIILQRVIEEKPGATRAAAWLLPILFTLWVNTHGSWLIGMVVLLAFVGSGWLPIHAGSTQGQGWTMQQRRDLALAGALSAACLFVNPYGWRLVFYPFDLAFRQKLNIANIEEWRTLDFHSPRGHILLISLTLLFIVQLCRGRRWAPYELAFLLIGVYASFTYSRFVFLAAILIFPVMAKDVPGLAPYLREHNKPWLNAVILCIMAFLVVHHFPARAEPAASGEHAFPERALPFLNQLKPQGNVFNEYLWGGYLEWHEPQLPVFIDSRVDIFEYSGVFEDYLDAVRLKNTLAILDKYHIHYVLFPQDAPMVYLLQHERTWRVLYQDGTTILFERSPVVLNTGGQP